MHLFELTEGPVALIVQHLAVKDRARLALTCHAGRLAALAAAVDQELPVIKARLASFNSWLCQRTAAGAGTVQTVRLSSDPHGRAVLAACLLARCGTKSLSLDGPSPGLIDAACTISSLTRLQLGVNDSRCSLDPLGALRQLQSLRVDFYPGREQGGAAPAWRLPLPDLTQLELTSTAPCTFGLDGCSALREVLVHAADDGLALTARRPLPQLTRLGLWHPNDLVVPWQQLPALRELVLQREYDAGLLEGATHLTSLHDLQVDCGTGFVLPPGAWLAGVTRLVLEDFASVEGPESLDWAASATGVEELVLWLDLYGLHGPPPAQHTRTTLKWVRWAGSLPRLRLLELRVGDDVCLDETELLCKAVRAEGEGVEAMLQRLLWDLAGQALHPSF